MDKSIHVEVHRTGMHNHIKVNEVAARIYTKSPAHSAEHFEMALIAPKEGLTANEIVYFAFPDGNRWEGTIGQLAEVLLTSRDRAELEPDAPLNGNGSYFSRWHNKEISNLGSFDTKLFELYYTADGSNRQQLIKAFPNHFTPRKNIRYVVTAIRGGQRQIAGAANHLNTYPTQEAAQSQLDAIKANNNPDTVADLMGTDLQVMPVECWAGGDPKQTVFQYGDEPNYPTIDPDVNEQWDGRIKG